MPSLIATDGESFGGASVLGLPHGDPTQRFGPSTSALSLPSGLSFVRCTASTLRGGTIRPGSGSSHKPKHAIIAGRYSPQAGRNPSVAGNTHVMPRDLRYRSAMLPMIGCRRAHSHAALRR
jgi:hypothetical protein